MSRVLGIMAVAAVGFFTSSSTILAKRHPPNRVVTHHFSPAQLHCDNNGRCTTLGPGSAERVHAPVKIARHRANHRVVDANGNSGTGIVISHKTGATARVAVSFAAKAQAVVDDLEQNHGAVIRFMGGYRRGRCASWSLHPCGLAIDLCQTARGRVDPRCHMPSRSVEIQVARAHSAYSGGVWCNQDRGHIQSRETAASCGQTLYSAVATFKSKRHRFKYRHDARR